MDRLQSVSSRLKSAHFAARDRGQALPGSHYGGRQWTLARPASSGRSGRSWGPLRCAAVGRNALVWICGLTCGAAGVLSSCRHSINNCVIACRLLVSAQRRRAWVKPRSFVAVLASIDAAFLLSRVRRPFTGVRHARSPLCTFCLAAGSYSTRETAADSNCHSGRTRAGGRCSATVPSRPSAETGQRKNQAQIGHHRKDGDHEWSANVYVTHPQGRRDCFAGGTIASGPVFR